MPKLQFGLGLNFTANTGKFIKAVDGASRSLDRLSRRTSEAEEIGKSLFNRISESKPFQKFERLTDKISASTDKLTGGLSSSLNSYVQMNREITETTANMGLVGKEAEKLKKALISLNLGYDISISNVAKLISLLKQGGIDITQNIDKIKQYAKMMEGLQVSPDVIASYFTYGKSVGLTEKQILSLIDRSAVLGKEIGNVSEVLEQYPSALQSIIEQTTAYRETFRKFGITHQDYAERTIQAAIAIGKATGKGFGEGIKAAEDLVSKLLDTHKGFAQLHAGIEGAEISRELVELGIITGDVGQAFRDMQKDPVLFIRKMSEFIKKLKESGREKSIEILRTRFENAFGVDFTRVIFDNADAFTTAIDSMNKSVAKSEGFADKVVKATLGTSGRTIEALQNQLDYQIGILKARALPLIITALKTFNKYIVKITKFISDISKKHPGIGKLLDKIIAFTEIGVSGFFAMTPVIFPVIIGLQSLGLVIGELASGFKFLFGLIGKGLGLFGKVGSSIAGILPFGKLLTGVFGKIFFWVGLIIAAIKPLTELFDKLGKIWSDKTKSAGDKVIEIFNGVIKAIWQIFDSFFFGIPQKIAEMLGIVSPKMPETKVAKKGKGKKTSPAKLEPQMASILGGFSFESVMNNVLNKVVKVAGQLLDMAGRWLNNNMDRIRSLITTIWTKTINFLKSLADNILPFTLSILEKVVEFISKIDWYSVLSNLLAYWKFMWSTGVDLAYNLITKYLPFLGIKLLKVLTKVVSAIAKGIVDMLFGLAVKIDTFIITLVKTIGSSWKDIITGNFGKVIDTFRTTWEEVSTDMSKVQTKMKGWTEVVFDTSHIDKFLDESAKYYIDQKEALNENTKALQENNELLTKSSKKKSKKSRIEFGYGIGGGEIKTEKSVSGVASNVGLLGGAKLRLKIVG